MTRDVILRAVTRSADHQRQLANAKARRRAARKVAAASRRAQGRCR